MFLLSLTATCQVCTVSLKAGLNTYNEVRQDGKYRLAGGALDAPDGETTQADTGVMGVAREAATLAAAGLVEELKAEGEEEGEDELDKRFGVAYEGKVGRLIVEIDGDGTVVAGRFGGLSHVSSPCRWLSVKMRHRERNVLKDQASYEGVTPLPHNPLECGCPVSVLRHGQALPLHPGVEDP
jgi:hypothetical protein